MLRAALPYRRRLQFATASACLTGTTVAAAAYVVRANDNDVRPLSKETVRVGRQWSNSTQCSFGDDNSSTTALIPSLSPLLSIQQVTDDIAQYTSLVLPTLEALHRAARLFATAATMAVDYQCYSIQRQQPRSMLSQLYKWTFLTSNEKDMIVNEDRELKRHELENAIDRLEKDLERAQHDYVNGPSGSETKYNTTSLSDRTLAKRAQKEVMLEIARDLSDAQDALSSLHNEDDTQNAKNNIHCRNALRLLRLCRTNGGVYVKVGQHLANLDLLLPEEYIQTLSSLFDNAPVSSYQDVCEVIKEELGSSPDELFRDFSTEPLASASLAQVHTAICKETGRKLAIKVQHRGLRETSRGDLFAMTYVVKLAEKMFDDFNFGWICEELTPQLPKELNFVNEGKNAEAAAAHLKQTTLDCIVPKIVWDVTNHRVLTMEFEEGFRATDVTKIDEAGLLRRDVAKLISSVFNSMIFIDGFVHCDPHEANVLLRPHPHKKGKPQIVLVDHGLYKKLDAGFKLSYARLWKSIVVADIPGIESSCESLGVKKMYPLLAAMLTSRPFDEVVERSQTNSFDVSQGGGGGDKAVIRGYAQRYLSEIISMLDIVPRQMLLIFKMNDCLRHVDYALGSPANTLVVAGRYASRAVYESDQKQKRYFDRIKSWVSYLRVLLRINTYELWTRLTLSQ